MGVTDRFIRDHEELVELVDKTPQMSIRQRMRHPRRKSVLDVAPTEAVRRSTGLLLRHQQCFSTPDDALDETRVSQGGSNPRSKSPDFAYRTPAVPADALYNMCQTTPKENCLDDDAPVGAMKRGAGGKNE